MIDSKGSTYTSTSDGGHIPYINSSFVFLC
jgi:hypothetical protein